MSWIKDEIDNAKYDVSLKEQRKQRLIEARQQNIQRIATILTELGDELFGRGFFGKPKYKLIVDESFNVRIEGLYGKNSIPFSASVTLVMDSGDTLSWYHDGSCFEDSDTAIKDALKKQVGWFIRNTKT